MSPRCQWTGQWQSPWETAGRLAPKNCPPPARPWGDKSCRCSSTIPPRSFGRAWGRRPVVVVVWRRILLLRPQEKTQSTTVHKRVILVRMVPTTGKHWRCKPNVVFCGSIYDAVPHRQRTSWRRSHRPHPKGPPPHFHRSNRFGPICARKPWAGEFPRAMPWPSVTRACSWDVPMAV